MSSFTIYRDFILDVEADLIISRMGIIGIGGVMAVLIDIAALRLIDDPGRFLSAYMHCMRLAEDDVDPGLLAFDTLE